MGKFLPVVLFVFSLSLYSKDLVPNKIIFITPEEKSSNTLKPIQNQLVAETISTLQLMDKELLISYLPYEKWQEYKSLIEDTGDPEKIGKFFIKTEVTGIMSLNIEDRVDTILVQVFFYDIDKRSLKGDFLEIPASSFINEMNNYTSFIKNSVSINFPGINIIKLKAAKIKQRIIEKKNPPYEVQISFGSGFASKKSLGGLMYFAGPSVYSNLDLKVLNFSLNLNIIGNYYFNINYPENKYFLYDVGLSLSLGGWFANQTFKFAGGLTFMPGNHFIERYSYDSSLKYQSELTKIDLYLLFFYVNFSFIPIRAFQFIFDIGSFISINRTTIKPYIFFPLYLRLGLRFDIYKNMFFDLLIPFYITAYKFGTKDDNETPSFPGMANFGIGWKIELFKKKAN